MDGNDKVDLRDRGCNDGNRINRSTGSCPVLNFFVLAVLNLWALQPELFSPGQTA